jgi:hypothetical protein
MSASSIGSFEKILGSWTTSGNWTPPPSTPPLSSADLVNRKTELQTAITWVTSGTDITIWTVNVSNTAVDASNIWEVANWLKTMKGIVWVTNKDDIVKILKASGVNNIEKSADDLAEEILK